MQKGISADPKSPPASAGTLYTNLLRTVRLISDAIFVFPGQNAEAAALIASLREMVQAQAHEIEALKAKLSGAASSQNEVR